MGINSIQNSLEDFIISSKWENIPDEVKQRVIISVVDHFNCLVSGSQTLSSECGFAMGGKLFRDGSIPIVGHEETFNMIGAITAHAYCINALDADDGYSILKGHPGAVIFGALLPCAIANKSSYREFLEAMVVAYEVSIRHGIAMQDYYNFYHGSGSWGTIGIAAGMGKLLNLDKDTLSSALAIADFHGPLTPVMRNVEAPSMNKDGVQLGIIIGALSVEAALNGMTGKNYILGDEKYNYLLNTLGNEWETLKLNYKWFPCCRWAQPAILAVMDIQKKHKIAVSDINKILIHTFEAATKLSTDIPTTSDEAQYSMAYPVCATLIEGHFTGIEVGENYMRTNPETMKLMECVEFCVNPEFEANFPAKRLASVTISTKNGELYASESFEPLGDPNTAVDINWVKEKFHMLCDRHMPSEAIDEIIKRLSDANMQEPIEEIIELINAVLLQNNN